MEAVCRMAVLFSPIFCHIPQGMGAFTTGAEILTDPTGREGELIFCAGIASRRKG